MDRFKGFGASKKDSLAKQAALALRFLLKQEGDRGFVSWIELFAAVTGAKVSGVDPDEVKRRLRGKGMLVKDELMNLGHGWMVHPSDRSLIRATSHGDDTLRNCRPKVRQRAVRGMEILAKLDERAVGSPDRILRTPENRAAVADVRLMSPRLRALMMTIGAMEGSAAESKAPRAKASS